jgi:hypothetical protein
MDILQHNHDPENLHGRLSALEARFSGVEDSLKQISVNVEKLLSFRTAAIAVLAFLGFIATRVGEFVTSVMANVFTTHGRTP